MVIPTWAENGRQLPIDIIPDGFNAHQRLAAQLAIASLCHLHQLAGMIEIPVEKLTPRDIVFAIEQEICR
jgi:hypothetical protein